MSKEPIDVLVIGTGIAGCCAALAAADGGARVVMVTRGAKPEDANTSQAQGGIIYEGPGDSPELLAADIQLAGAQACDPRAVQLLAEEGPRLVREILIERLKTPFDRAATGDFDLTQEGAHSVPRIIHADDLTGRAIELQCLKAVEEHPHIEVRTRSTAIDLLTLSHHSRQVADKYRTPTCIGAYVLHQQEEAVHAYLARHTVLATGGLGQIYLHTTNLPGSRGDGIAMAYRAGARLLNLEYIQFHPTMLSHPQADGFLISESLRGEGAVLRLPNGEEFMEKYHQLKSLAPRDVVSRAIHEEMLENGCPCVHLDITHKGADWVRGRFPNIYAKCAELGIDITKQPIPVVPAAHYSCGGISVDDFGRASFQRLWAVGEVSCTGLHGANRLASTSLLEGLVWGWRCGQELLTEMQQGNDDYFPEVDEWRHVREAVDPALIKQDWLTIKHTMWNYVGLVRSHRRLKRAYHILRQLQIEVNDFYERAEMTDAMIGLRNGVQTALAVLHAAYENRESRGAHFRTD
jgi:L-aspartate oxidase